MAKNLSKALGTDLAGLAQLLRSKGRGKDTILAHINPQEAALLKRAGGSGEPNPETGLPEFQQDYSFGEFYDQPSYYDQLDQTQTQEDYSRTPANPYTDSSLYPGNEPPRESLNQSSTMYTPEGNVSYGTSEQLQAGYAQDMADMAAAQNIGRVPQGQDITGGYYPEGASVYSPVNYGAEDLNRIAVGQMPKETIQAQQPSFLDEFTKQTKTALTKPDTLGRLGLAGGLGLIGALQNKRLAGQSQAATAEQKAIAQPYTETGQKLMTQAQAGQLTPQSQASLDAAKARIAQSVAGRGGVGQQQSANQIAQIYNNLLDSQYKYGLQVAQIGDNIALGAIRTGLQMDRSMAQTTNNFYTQLAQIAGGGTYGYLPPTVVRGA
jgi:hypothetical protein